MLMNRLLNTLFSFLVLFLGLTSSHVSSAQQTRTVTINSDGASESGFTISPSASAYTYNTTCEEAKLLSLAKSQTYTVSIPSGVTVTAASFYACVDNNTSNKGGLTDFNGMSCDYKFVNRKSAEFTTVNFDNLSITSSLTFLLNYNSGVALTLTVTGENTGPDDTGSDDNTGSGDSDSDDGGNSDSGTTDDDTDDTDNTTGSTFDPNDPSEGTPDPGTALESTLNIVGQGGWFEAAYIEWELIAEAANYNVYIKAEDGDYARINKNLVRNYGTYGRADMVGLKAGNYKLKVVAVADNGNEMTCGVESDLLTVRAHDRGGFAHKDGKAVGAYNNDGTLKANTQVIYVTDDNFDTVTGTIFYEKANKEFIGIGNILKALEKGTHTDPICIRVVGAITSCAQLYGDADALQLKGKNNTIETPVTIEGIGSDATFKTFGIVLVKANCVEVRNLGFNAFADDGISIKESVKIWIHNNDIFYGATGSASDQAKGDGSLDVKDDSQYCTFSYNHFLDAGKSSLCGMKSESGENFICYHHNWFNHSDSRHPRVRTMTVHVYNNYYDGVSKYGIGATTGSNVFVENNYFRNTNRPMMSSLQGTDATGDGTFSGEDGGMIKAYGNIMVETGSNYSFIAANSVPDALSVTAVSATSFDAYYASSRDEQVPASFVALKGGTSYNNFDTDASKMHTYSVDKAIDVPAVVMRWAGRMNGGDYHWIFNNAVDDYDYGVNTEMKSQLSSYVSPLIEVGTFTNVTADAARTYNAKFYADTDGNAVFQQVECNGSLIYPDGVPTLSGYIFVGWSLPQGKALTADVAVYPLFSDGKSAVTPPAAAPEVAIVKEWYFNAWSATSQSAVAGSDVWTKDASTDRYDASFVERTSLGIAETEGLEFLNKVRISFDSGKGLYLQGSFTMYVPVTEGETVKVTFSNTGSSNGSRDLLINDEVVASSDNTTKQTASYVVPAGVTELTVKGSGGLNYFSIVCSKETNSLSALDMLNSAEHTKTEYFSLSGKRLSKPCKGVTIAKYYMSDGSVRVKKILTK